MFCPTCGAQSTQELRYCNRCGANLKGQSETGSPGTSINSLVWAIVVTTILLLGMGLGALVLMKDGDIAPGLGSAFVILCFLMLPVVEGVLVAQYIRLNKKAKQENWRAEGKSGTTRELDAAPARSLAQMVEHKPSVTEQTTRELEPVYRKGERQ